MHLNAFFRHARIGADGQPRPARERHRPDDRPRPTTCCSRRRSTRSSSTAGRAVRSRSTSRWDRRHLHRRATTTGVRFLDVSASLDDERAPRGVFVVNRTPRRPERGRAVARRRPLRRRMSRSTRSTGPSLDATNTWDDRDARGHRTTTLETRSAARPSRTPCRPIPSPDSSSASDSEERRAAAETTSARCVDPLASERDRRNASTTVEEARMLRSKRAIAAAHGRHAPGVGGTRRAGDRRPDTHRPVALGLRGPPRRLHGQAGGALERGQPGPAHQPDLRGHRLQPDARQPARGVHGRARARRTSWTSRSASSRPS